MRPSVSSRAKGISQLEEERVPFQITAGAVLYEGVRPLPVTVLLEDLRSLYNVGSFFRIADAAAVESLLLCGITGQPPQKGIAKTALGAENTVPWRHCDDSISAAHEMRSRGYELAVIETGVRSLDLFDWTPRFPVCVIFGNELHGVRADLSAICDTQICIPMLGFKHSLNVATAGSAVIFELLRKYRALVRAADDRH